MRISEHLVRAELDCRCGCGFSACDIVLVDTLEKMMAHFEQLKGRRLKLHITSGNRCAAYNAKIGAEKSKHVAGIAADFWVEDIHEDEVADYLESEYPSTFGIGRYDGRTHLDVRFYRARWDNRT